jgi:hypothetical protein
MTELLGLPTRTAEGGVKGIIRRLAIENRFASPTQNRARSRPEGDIFKNGLL